MLSYGVPQLFDVCLSSGIVFITVWFFFIQSPFLFNVLGRNRFVPIMMKMTQLFFDTMVILNLAVFGVSFLTAGLATHTLAALVAVSATLFNTYVIVPRALAAGKASAVERAKNENTSSVKDFAIEGGSKTETKTLHQTVVAFVLVMVGGLIMHILLMK